MNKKVSFKGDPMTLMGRPIKPFMHAPDFKVTSSQLKEVRFSDIQEAIKLIISFPSLDTPVCDLQVKEFNKKALSFSSEVAVIGISKDLPFAQKRFCQENNIDRVRVYSDYKTSSFGINYGLLIKELNLLARAVIIVDKQNLIRYVEIVDELTEHPRYEEALKALQEVIKNPTVPIKGETTNQCKPCEGGAPALPRETIEKLLALHRGWKLDEEGKKLIKKLTFDDFLGAKYFLDLIALIAEEQGHHPKLTLNYNTLIVTLTTHAAGGLTDNDFIMAQIIDTLNN